METGEIREKEREESERRNGDWRNKREGERGKR
jgi:hypothetical protein